MPMKIDPGPYLTTTELVDWLRDNPGIKLAATARSVHYLTEKGIIPKPLIRQAGTKGESLYPQRTTLIKLREEERKRRNGAE